MINNSDYINIRLPVYNEIKRAVTNIRNSLNMVLRTEKDYIFVPEKTRFPRRLGCKPSIAVFSYVF